MAVRRLATLIFVYLKVRLGLAIFSRTNLYIVSWLTYFFFWLSHIIGYTDFPTWKPTREPTWKPTREPTFTPVQVPSPTDGPTKEVAFTDNDSVQNFDDDWEDTPIPTYQRTFPPQGLPDNNNNWDNDRNDDEDDDEGDDSDGGTGIFCSLIGVFCWDNKTRVEYIILSSDYSLFPFCIF